MAGIDIAIRLRGPVSIPRSFHEHAVDPDICARVRIGGLERVRRKAFVGRWPYAQPRTDVLVDSARYLRIDRQLGPHAVHELPYERRAQPVRRTEPRARRRLRSARQRGVVTTGWGDSRGSR